MMSESLARIIKTNADPFRQYCLPLLLLALSLFLSACTTTTAGGTYVITPAP